MAETNQESHSHANSIVIRPWPKIIFLYPTFIAALIAGVWQLFVGPDGSGADAVANEHIRQVYETVGLLFFLVFAFNLLVISFEFSRIKTLAILFLVIAVVFFALFMSTKFPVLSIIKDGLNALHLRMTTSFYFTIAGYFLLIYAMVFVNTRWNYWVVRHNEIIHYTGFLGDIRRYPSPNLRMSKTIDDVFEYILLGAGRITLYPQSEREAIVLENVLGVTRVEKAVKALLSEIAVRVTHAPAED